MAIRKKDLLKEQKQVEIEMTQGTLSVTFKPANWTARIKEQVMNAKTNEEAFTLISEAIEQWDYLGEDDKPLPVTSETFYDMPDGMPMSIMLGLSGGLPNASSSSSTTPSVAGEEEDD